MRGGLCREWWKEEGGAYIGVDESRFKSSTPSNMIPPRGYPATWKEDRGGGARNF